MAEPMRLLRLMHLCSATLPVGAYAFSHGLEYAIEAGWVRDADGVRDWLRPQVHHGLARVELPLLARAMAGAPPAQIDELLLACRESREQRLAELAMGEALARLLPTLDVPLPPAPPRSFLALFALACRHWSIDAEQAALGYLWSWLENQVAAATKLVPLGQSAAQALLVELQAELPAAVDAARSVGEDEIGACLPALAMAGALHETQYSRLFRS